MKKELITQKEPKSPISEIFRTLRTNIQFMNTKGRLKSILVTSTLPGEGKSWISANLAVTFAQANYRVVLVDADMRKGKQYSLFERAPRPGLSNYLSTAEIRENSENLKYVKKFIQGTDIENLYLMPAGNVPPNPSELLISPQMEELVEQLKELFDIVIIDGTPNQLVTDSLIITRLVDTTMIVVSSNNTKKEELRRCIDNIKRVGGNVSGVVLNKIEMNAKKYEQSYYYGSTSATKMKTKEDIKNQKKVGALNTKKSQKKNDEAIDKLVKKNSENKSKEKISESTAADILKELDTEDIEKMANMKKEDKTSLEILKQINEYLEKEKQELEKKKE